LNLATAATTLENYQTTLWLQWLARQVALIGFAGAVVSLQTPQPSPPTTFAAFMKASG
jgi:hypothetical protein